VATYWPANVEKNDIPLLKALIILSVVIITEQGCPFAIGFPKVIRSGNDSSYNSKLQK